MTNAFRQDSLSQRLVRRARSDETGSALIELAMALSFLGIPLLLGTIYVGMLLFYSTEVANAAHAGALYGMQSSTFAADSDGITSASQSEATDVGASLNVAPAIFYACSSAIDGTQYTTQAAATTACTGGSNHALEFVQVTASYGVTPFARIPGMQKTITVSTTSVMEVEE